MPISILLSSAFKKLTKIGGTMIPPLDASNNVSTAVGLDQSSSLLTALTPPSVTPPNRGALPKWFYDSLQLALRPMGRMNLADTGGKKFCWMENKPSLL
jgi:hypothetical protein